MKRSSSEPNLSVLNLGTKKSKLLEVPSTKEYLQLALTKIIELQQQMKEDSTLDSTSDLGDSENEEDTMKDVLIQVFKDLPGSSPSTASIIEKAMKPSDPRLNAIRTKSIQLVGYDTCRRVAMDFMKNVVKFTPAMQNNRNEPRLMKHPRVGTSCELNSQVQPKPIHSTEAASDYEIRLRMLKSLDLHLAAKQRDYIATLMRQ